MAWSDANCSRDDFGIVVINVFEGIYQVLVALAVGKAMGCGTNVMLPASTVNVVNARQGHITVIDIIGGTPAMAHSAPVSIIEIFPLSYGLAGENSAYVCGECSADD